jgi:Na+/proline symporter
MIGGMMTVFFFAKNWRKANITTDLELTELRYSGKPAAFLRGFKSVYLGLWLNAVIIAWVNVAMAGVLKVYFELSDEEAFWSVAGLMFIVGIYSSLSGLLGVAVTDAVQFVTAMTGCIVLAFMVTGSEKIGGIAGLKANLPAGTLDFFPKLSFSESSTADNISQMTLGLMTFLSFVGLQWWASWYPGAEPGGGGYVAQRMMSAKTEKDALRATLLFQVAHYALRPWAWILVALAALILYPDLPEENRKLGYVMAMKEFLPQGLSGLMLAAFLAAYMSTISTQLNWGAGYLMNDFYLRFVKKDASNSQKVLYSRIATIAVMFFALLVTRFTETLSGAFLFMIESGAGLGAVLILRWYWWRINAWSEISATVAPFVGFALSKFVFEFPAPYGMFFTTGFTTFVWLLVTFLTKPEPVAVLQSFYHRIEPAGYWGVFADKASQKPFGRLFLSWFSGILLGYSVLFLIGDLIFRNYERGFVELLIAIICLWLLRKNTEDM